MITKPKKKETKTYLALIVIGIALVLGCPASSSPSPVTESVPAAAATGVDGNKPIVLTYSGTVVKGTGDITISHATEDDIVIPVTAAGVTLVVNAAATPPTTTVTITPDSPLAEGETTIAIPAGVFKVDTAEGADVGAFSLAFTVAAAVVSPVTESVPAADATDHPANENIVLTYSGTVVEATGDSVPKITVKVGTAAAVDFAGDVAVVANAAVAAAGAVAAQPATTTVTLNPTANLAVNTSGQTTTVTIPAGFFKVDTAAGADVAAYSLSFTVVADTTGPTLVSSVPSAVDPNDSSNSGVAVDANIVLTFDEVVVKGTGNISNTYSAGSLTNPVIDVTSATAVTVSGAVVTINPPTDLLAGQTHVFTIPADAFEDEAGNGNAEIVIEFATVPSS